MTVKGRTNPPNLKASPMIDHSCTSFADGSGGVGVERAVAILALLLNRLTEWIEITAITILNNPRSKADNESPIISAPRYGIMIKLAWLAALIRKKILLSDDTCPSDSCDAVRRDSL